MGKQNRPLEGQELLDAIRHATREAREAYSDLLRLFKELEVAQEATNKAIPLLREANKVLATEACREVVTGELVRCLEEASDGVMKAYETLSRTMMTNTEQAVNARWKDVRTAIEQLARAGDLNGSDSYVRVRMVNNPDDIPPGTPYIDLQGK